MTVEKMRKYCLFTDRCHQDVRSKLIKDRVYGEELEQVIAILIEEDFLNEERFAKAYALGKFRQNKWGKKKITMHLKAKNVSPYCIRKGLEEIEEEEYFEVLESLWTKKLKTLKDENDFIKKQKTAKYLMSKGFDYSDIKNFM